MDGINKIMEFIGQAMDFMTWQGQKASELARLKSQTATCEDIIRKNYMELGKKYFDKYGETPDPAFEKQCRSIKNAKRGAEALQKKMNEIKER